MSRLNLTWRIAAAVAMAILTGAAACALLVWQLRGTTAAYDAILGDHEVQHQDRARVMQVEFKKQVQEWKDLLLRGHNHDDFQKYRDAFKQREAAVKSDAESLLSEVTDQEAKKSLQTFLAAHDAMASSYDAAIQAFAASKGQNPDAADVMVKGIDRGPTDAIDALVARLQQVIQDVRKSTQDDVAGEIRGSVTTVLVSFAIVLIVVAFVIRSTRKELVQLTISLTQAAHSTASAAAQVSSSAQSLSQGATEQAASLEETSASMEEMSSMTRRNAENSQSAANLMGEVDTRVKDSNQALADMVSSMGSIRESSRQVAKIIKTIDEIAFQTNILALNAAVEAARAGEAGMGFAVVADEVRNLAQRSAQAAKDTAELIEASIQKTEGGSHKVEQVAASITAITDSVVKVKALVDDVSGASRQQSQGIDQVSQAIAQMEKVTQTTAATAEESAAASEELSAQAATALGVVGRLESLVGATHVRTAGTHQTPRSTRSASPVVRMRPHAEPRPAPSPNEELLPLGDTGTYGKF